MMAQNGQSTFQFAFFPVAIILLLSGKCAHGAPGYNESCSIVHNPCDSSKYLVCNPEDRCACANNAIYHGPDIEECRLKSEELCETQQYPDQKCVPYSECTSRGSEPKKCICISSLNPLLDGTCPKMGFGENCTESEEKPCDDKKFLKCEISTNVCDCQNPLNAIYDEKSQKCQLLVGVECISDSNPETQQCVTRADCWRNQCQCNFPFEVNSRRKCSIPYGEECSLEKPCDVENYVECNSGECLCKNKENTYFDTTDKTCHFLHNTDCARNPTGQKCAPNSFCDEENTGKCQCDTPDLQPNELRRCALTYDRRCNVSNNLCDEFKYLECDPQLSRCSCKLKSETIFDQNTQKCQLLANAPCIPTEGSQKCIVDSTCESTGTQGQFMCQCIGSLDPNKLRKCVLDYSETCDETKDKCDPAGFLKCDENSHECQCMANDMEFEPTKKQCYILPNGNCSLVGENNPSCGGNAECTENNICSCKLGYESTDSGRALCLLQYGQRCTNNEESQCNTYKGLECVNGTCGCDTGKLPGNPISGVGGGQCFSGHRQSCRDGNVCYAEAYLTCAGGICYCLSESEQTYDTEFRKCFSLPGKRCNLNAIEPNQAMYCSKNADCVPNSNSGGDATYGVCQCRQGFTHPSHPQDCMPDSSVLIVPGGIMMYILSLLISSF